MALPGPFTSADAKYQGGAKGVLTVPQSAFQNWSLRRAATTAEGLQADQRINNIELRQMMMKIYKFAQSSGSKLLPILRNRTNFVGAMMTYYRESKADWVVKSVSAAKTPRTEMEYDKRAIFSIPLHQSLVKDKDVMRGTDVDITAGFQQELMMALGRNIDKFAQRGVIRRVAQLSTTIDNSFMGGISDSQVKFSAKNTLLRVTGAPISGVTTITTLDNNASTNPSPAESFFDDMALRIEDALCDPSEYVVIGSPKYRRSLKKIAKLRDKESTLVFMGDENGEYLRDFMGFDHCILKKDSFQNLLDIFQNGSASATDATQLYLDAQAKYNNKGYYSSSGTAIGTRLDGTTVAKGSELESILFLHRDNLTFGIDEGASFQRYSELAYDSYAEQFYTHAPNYAFGRVDETKDFVVLYKPDGIG